MLDKFITASGSREGGTYFLGGRYSYAETVTTPFLRRALLVLKAHRGFDILDLASSNGLNRLLQWIQVHCCCLYSTHFRNRYIAAMQLEETCLHRADSLWDG